MYARLARFEGSDRDVLDREIEEMRKQIQAMKSGQAMAAMSEQTTGGQLERTQMEMLQKAIKRTLVLVDRDKGGSAMVVFCDSEDDVRRIDEMFNQMSPGEGGGKRQSADIYEVAIDEQMS